MTLLDSAAAALEFDTVGGPLVDQLEGTLTGKSPYLGTLPWLASFEAHEERIDGEYVSTLREEGGKELVRLASHDCFLTLACLYDYFEQLLDLKHGSIRSAREMRNVLAEHGYRLVAHATGKVLGHVSTHVLMADAISQLDAALQLRASPAAILDILDEGADPTRSHIKFGQPYQAALLLATTRPEYQPVVDYMRGLGAH